MSEEQKNTNEEPIQCAMSEDQPDLSVVEVSEEAPAIKQLLGNYAEIPIRAFLMANMKESFTEPDKVDVYLVDDARIVAEYMSDAGRLYQADFLFYESSQPRIGGMMVKESVKEKFWVMQATTGWVTHYFNKIKEEVESKQAKEECS